MSFYACLYIILRSLDYPPVRKKKYPAPFPPVVYRFVSQNVNIMYLGLAVECSTQIIYTVALVHHSIAQSGG